MPTFCCFIQLLEFPLLFLRILRLSVASVGCISCTLLLDGRVLSLSPTAGLVEWAVIWVGRPKGWEWSCKQDPSSAAYASSCACRATFSHPRWTEGLCAVLRLLASGSANPTYIQVRLVTLTSVLQVNGDAAQITDLPGLDIN